MKKKCIMKKKFPVSILDNGITYSPGVCEVDEDILKLYPALFTVLPEEAVVEEVVEEEEVADVDESKNLKYAYPSM